MKLANQIAAVMGGGHTAAGLSNGAAVALQFAQEGATVYVVDRDLAAAQRTLDLIQAECPGNPSVALSADVTDEVQVHAVFQQIERAHGRLDVLHNNVGVECMGGILETSTAQWRQAFALNVESAIQAMRQAIPMMQRQQRGAIINVSSAASMKYSGVKYVSYNTTKAALNQLSKVVAGEYARDGIRCNVLVPGMIATPHVVGTFSSADPAEVERVMAQRAARVPLGRQGTPQDVAKLALFLASDDSAFITGQLMVADGGALI